MNSDFVKIGRAWHPVSKQRHQGKARTSFKKVT